MQAANRVVLNTGFLYGKMLITMLIALYATRLVLNGLGAVDYGIFNLVAGIVAMLSFLNSSMTLSTQRYMSFFLGSGDLLQLKKAFNSGIWLHLFISVTVVGLLELSGIYLFGHVLNIPADRVTAAHTIFHFMTASAFFTIVSVPYDAMINTHENMLLLAVLGIVESLVKLGLAVSLAYLGGDKLIFYSAGLALLLVLLLLFKWSYCTARYKESRISVKYFDRKLLREMFSYSGWAMVGASGVIAKTQGIAMVLNVFFGTVINAAFAIANQVNAQLSYFAVTMLQALNPQLVKSEGSGNRERMMMLSLMACKFAFYLLSFFAIPAIIEMPYILHIWLKNYPDHTVAFCRLIIAGSLVYQLSGGLQMAVQAVGRIKTFQLVLFGLLLLNIPGAYLLLQAGFPPAAVLTLSLFIECAIAAYRMLAAKRLTGIPVRSFLVNVVWHSLLPVGVAACIALAPSYLMDEGFARLAVTGFLAVFSLGLMIRFFGLSPYELQKLTDMTGKALAKITRKSPVLNAN
ncbi:oligosaccharide flippase family protein [Chitinophaga sp. GCM10012297]|uniref:Oligosaccharide flippase family protein n=1 Tax=Chitinophaga chungangae TaxID=2821488 RepID=A0ABS3YCM1_9BACT|nr:oligosaccharide flippase family protein [Chitinophaga chungangae]MBO9152048.1 oligosaccharide flippase family protein [Chitinophaga chungangae]